MKYHVDKESLKGIMTDIDKRVNKALLYCGEYLQGKIQEEIMIDSYDTGNLARSINYQLIKDGVVEVGTNLDYAVIREYGRKPGKFPPMDAIASWSARKGLISGGVNTGYNNLHYKDKGIVFVIARAIAERGIEGKYTFQKVYDREKDNVIKIFNDYITMKG